MPELYIRLHVIPWFQGTMREDLTPAQRSVWADLLAQGALGKGDIKFTDYDHLSRIFNTPPDVIESAIKICVDSKRLKWIKSRVKGEKILRIINWKQYQSAYLHQKEAQKRYRDRKKAENSRFKIADSSEDPGSESIDRGEERIKKDRRLKERREKGEERKGEESQRGEENHGEDTIKKNHPRDQFLQLLKDFSGIHPYPFDQEADGQIYDYCIEKFREVDPIRELEKKIEYWKQNPGALNSLGKGSRQQLIEFIELEAEYQRDLKD